MSEYDDHPRQDPLDLLRERVRRGDDLPLGMQSWLLDLAAAAEQVITQAQVHQPLTPELVEAILTYRLVKGDPRVSGTLPPRRGNR